MQEELINKVLKEVMKRVGSAPAAKGQPAGEKKSNPFVSADSLQLTEFVGVGLGDTQGIVIANVDPLIHEKMGIDKRFRSIGVIGGRTGAGPRLSNLQRAS